MVAYSFNRQFVPLIQEGTKSQTIRAHRKRHARVGEALQLYTGMRTRACQLIRDDVVCCRIDEISMDFRGLADEFAPETAPGWERLIRATAIPVIVNGMPLTSRADLCRLAMHDGFSGWGSKGAPMRPWSAMVLFWMSTFGPIRFDGVMISWEPKP